MRPLLVTLTLLCALSAAAQELDIFDPTDFIDPRERGTVFREGRFGVEQAGQPFSLVRVYGGRVSDYQWRTTATDADVSFVHAAASFYRGARQLNVKLTRFHAEDEAKLPHYRATMQVGRYFLSDPIAVQGLEAGARISGRLLFTWSMEENPYRDDPTTARRDRFNHDFGLQADMRLPIPRVAGADHIDGSFLWLRRRIDEGTYVDRVSYLYRFRQRLRSNGRLRLNASLGGGAERTESWHCCAARAVVTASFTIPRIDTGINVAFAPTFSPASDGRRTHYEVAIYLDRTVLARLGDLAGQ
jgi:hypothetical protein